MNRRRILRTTALATLVLPALLAFQWTNQKKDKPRDPNIRNVQGLVRLPDEALAQGAVVKIKNLKTNDVRSYITQTDGKYHFQNLSTSIDYELRADFQGMSSPTRTLSVFDQRLDAIVNLKLEAKK